jgi:DNA-binding response OmpR family regulator
MEELVESAILLVEDHQAVREALADFLTDQGYRVYQEADGHGAFSRYIESGPFTFVISDYQFIPGQQVSSCGRKILNGSELLCEIRKITPTQPMALMSGDYRASSYLDESLKDLPVLKKPFNLRELLELISKA